MLKITTICLAVIIMLSYFVNRDSAVGKEDRLIYIINSLEKMGTSVDEWSIYYKYNYRNINSLDHFKTIESEIKDDNPNFQWSLTEGEHHVKLTGTKTHNGNREQISVAAVKDGNIYNVLQTFNYTSKEWSLKRYQNIVKEHENTDNMYFTVKGVFKPSTESSLSKEAMDILNDLSASPTESLEERDFVSISAYKSQWETHLFTSNNKKMNLQLGLRRDGKKGLTHITVGSPIIIIEY